MTFELSQPEILSEDDRKCILTMVHRHVDLKGFKPETESLLSGVGDRPIFGMGRIYRIGKLC